MRHFFYFEELVAAEAALQELRELGLGVSVREAPGEENVWVVLAQASSERTAFSRPAFESLADRHGGEYDGWEAEDVRA